MQHIIRHLFRVDTLEEVPRERLEELVGSYPSFSIGRYLLSLKLQTENAGHFSEETQKTNLYFTNPFWLQWLLQNEARRQNPSHNRTSSPAHTREQKPMTDEPAGSQEPTRVENTTEIKSAVTEQPIVTERPVLEQDSFVPEKPLTEEHITVAEPPAIGEQIPIAEQSPVEDKVAPGSQPVFEETASGSEQGIAEEHAFSAEQTANEEQSFSAEQTATEETPATTSGPVIVEEPGATEELPRSPLSAAESLLQNLEEARELRQSLVTMNVMPSDEPAHNEQSAGLSSIDHATNEHPVINPAAGWPSEEFIPEEEPATDYEELAPMYEPADFEKAKEAIAAKVAAQTAETRQTPPGPEAPAITALPNTGSAPGTPATGPETAPPAAIVSQSMPLAEPIVMFEPYHTIDYFASVGIKFVQEENPQDKLGRQLKSFTEWLKVMRKLPQKNQEIVPDVAAEHQIQAIAAHSIKGKEVLTETMAEVLVKQGMREKAVEVYHKLSLLNPEKSAYFAARIEQLKID